MFRIVLVALALHLGLTRPDLHGMATYYGPPAFRQGDTMANGGRLDLNAPTVAVDVSHRDEWLDRSAVILTECGGLHRVRVTDTGRLYQVGGWFRYGIRGDQLRYWPVEVESEAPPVLAAPVLEEPTTWLDDYPVRVVADFPQRYFAAIACKVDTKGNGDTMKVWVWVR